MERWESGLIQRFAKPPYGLTLYRGFESPPLRSNIKSVIWIFMYIFYTPLPSIKHTLVKPIILKTDCILITMVKYVLLKLIPPPWDLIHYEILTTRAEAMKKENGLNRNPGEKRSLKFLIIIFTIIQPTETNGLSFRDHQR